MPHHSRSRSGSNLGVVQGDRSKLEELNEAFLYFKEIANLKVQGKFPICCYFIWAVDKSIEFKCVSQKESPSLEIKDG